MSLSSKYARSFLFLVLLVGPLLVGCKSASIDGEQSAMVKAVDAWQIKENWRRLRKGMSEDEVKGLLGKPDRKEFGRWRTYWRYGTETDGPQVMFGADTKKVDTWEEPKD